MPKPKTTSPTAEFIRKAVDLSGKTNREIAEQAGFPRPNVISMLTQGQMKLPLERAPALARACHVDPVHLVRLAMSEYQPQAWETLVDTIGEPLTKNEADLLIVYRMCAPQDEIAITPVVAGALIDLFDDFKDEG